MMTVAQGEGARKRKMAIHYLSDGSDMAATRAGRAVEMVSAQLQFSRWRERFALRSRRKPELLPHMLMEKIAGKLIRLFLMECELCHTRDDMTAIV